MRDCSARNQNTIVIVGYEEWQPLYRTSLTSDCDKGSVMSRVQVADMLVSMQRSPALHASSHAAPAAAHTAHTSSAAHASTAHSSTHSHDETPSRLG